MKTRKISNEEKLARRAYKYHRSGEHGEDTGMPLIHREFIRSCWSELEQRRYFESAGLYFPASKQIGPPPGAATREAQQRMDLEGCAAQLREYFTMAEQHDSPLRVALVGNGGLSKADREELHRCNFDHIVRFNDQKNYEVGDAPSTLHAVRHRVDGNDAPFTGLASYKRSAPLLLLGSGITLKPLNELKGVYKCPDGDWYDVAATLDITKLEIFPGEEATEFINRDPRAQKASSGLYTMTLLQSIEEVGEIHTFGMNWNFTEEAACSDEEGHLVRNSGFYDKVIVHETPTEDYDPPLAGEEASSRGNEFQKTLDRIAPSKSMFMAANNLSATPWLTRNISPNIGLGF
jgi:hypothetical protein